VRLNNRSMGQLRLPCEQAQAAYAAYRTWAALAVGRERTDYAGPDELVERASLRPPLFR